MRMRDSNRLVDQVPSRQGRYQQVADNLRVKEVTIDGADGRFIICHNPIRAERDAQHREQAIARIEAELERISTQRARDAKRPRGDKTRKKDEAAHVRSECALRDHLTLGRWLRQQANGRLVIGRRRSYAGRVPPTAKGVSSALTVGRLAADRHDRGEHRRDVPLVAVLHRVDVGARHGQPGRRLEDPAPADQLLANRGSEEVQLVLRGHDVADDGGGSPGTRVVSHAADDCAVCESVVLREVGPDRDLQLGDALRTYEDLAVKEGIERRGS
jgi:hypothetical protein